jgi:ATP-dependent Clp protease ATP-binding subunit ClpA
MILQECFSEHDESAACSEAKEGYTDNEIRKVVPVLYRKHLNKEYLVGNECGGDKKD